MKKLLLLSALLIFACSSDDSSDDNNNNNNSGLLNCDGNPIPSIVYGSQQWTVENACHITYRDGTPIPQVTDQIVWNNTTRGAWCYYDNDPTKPRLYNWYAVMGIHDNVPETPNKEFAPEGWHVPSDAEWTTLVNFLIAYGYNYDGTDTGNKIAKAMASNTGWQSLNDFPDSELYTGCPGYNQSLNNSSGFNAFPNGVRYGESFGLGNWTAFWSSTESAPWTNQSTGELETYGVQYQLFSSGFSFNSDGDFKQSGSSVRLVKD